MRKIKKGFTLAEMMVVMLIMSIILAAMAPVMTSRSGTTKDSSSPWRYAENNYDAYYSSGAKPDNVAMIGQAKEEDGSRNSTLVINTNNGSGIDNHIKFRAGNSDLGYLRIEPTRLLIGKLATQTYTTFGENSIGIGNPLSSDSYGGLIVQGKNSVAIGISAAAQHDNSTAIGYDSYAYLGDGTAVGAKATAYKYALALGANAVAKGESSVAIGRNANSGTQPSTGSATGTGSIAIGDSAKTINNSAIAIGHEAFSSGERSISIGKGANGDQSNDLQNDSIAIGTDTHVRGTNGGVAIGTRAQALGQQGIAIGVSSDDDNNMSIPNKNTIAQGSSTVAIGRKALAKQDNSIAIGHDIITKGKNSINIGSGLTKKCKDDDSNCGDNNILMGYNVANGNSSTTSSSYTIGENNIAIGEQAIYATDIIGNKNIAIGYQALIGKLQSNSLRKVGSNNIAIGNNACSNIEGSNKVCIGNNSGPSSTSNKPFTYNDDKVIFLGDTDTTVYIPGNLIVGKTTVLGVNSHLRDDQHEPTLVFKPTFNPYWTVHEFARIESGDINNNVRIFSENDEVIIDDFSFKATSSYESSDRRLKYVGAENKSGLDKIRQLKIFNYTFKKDETKEPHVGVIAQDLQKIFPNAVKKAADGFLKIRFEDMFYAMINAIKELDAKVTALEKENQEIKASLKQLEKRIQKLENK